jgi:alkanesulfonate monooxygenase SsuD/methylene tetrahydromethanopterin reductase-like flavin-dependent oxidoreductase (luciferase family)
VGVGHGIQDWMAQVGEKVGSPLTLMREHLSALSGPLDGQTVTVKGRYIVLDGVALDWPPDTHVDLLAAATGPKTLRLSGELARGTVISGGTTPSALRDAVAHIRAGTALRDTSSPHSVTTYLPCATGPDARRRATADLDSQADANGPVAAYGTSAEIADAARLWVDAGADTIVFQPPADEDFARFTSFIGTEVRGLLAC